ncbi:uncharacterized protein [Rutidosis leptorrhynchoides]|uniref:uncharacterized protein n=1 Tax=Rutidosis leptorrhynchoides TaxID=125765 RepID=UPI003A9A4C67
MYGQPPPLPIVYTSKDSRVEAIYSSLTARGNAIVVLKFHLKRAQDRMKNLADKHRTDRAFEFNSWVYVKLKPHREVTLGSHKYNKLSPKYYGPFQFLSKVGAVAYKLLLTAQAQIHHVFHISQLTQHKGALSTSVINIPALDDNGQIALMPVKILGRKLMKKDNKPVIYGLIQWKNGEEEDATRESLEDLELPMEKW